VRVVVAGGRWPQPGGEVAEPGAHGDAGPQRDLRRLDLVGAGRRRGHLVGEPVPGERERGTHPLVGGQVAVPGARLGLGGRQHGQRGERRPLGVVGGAQAQRLGRLVERYGDGQGGGRVLLGEGVELAGQPPRPVRHPRGAVPAGRPAGGVACGDAEEQSFNAVRAGRRLRPRTPVE
jgi:hypothetical protein